MRAYRAISLRAKLRPPGGDSPVAMGFSLLHIQGKGDLCPRWMNQTDKKILHYIGTTLYSLMVEVIDNALAADPNVELLGPFTT